MKPWSHKLLESAVAVFAAVWLLSLAWRLLVPLVPALVFAGLVVGFLKWRSR